MVTGIVLLFVIIYFLHIIEPHCHGLHGPPGVVSMSIRDIIGFKPLLKKKKKASLSCLPDRSVTSSCFPASPSHGLQPGSWRACWSEPLKFFSSLLGIASLLFIVQQLLESGAAHSAHVATSAPSWEANRFPEDEGLTL